MTSLESLWPELERVRSYSKSIECASWTSDTYQRDILDFILSNADKGSGIVEVGAYKGGFTVQLATVCKALGWTMDSIDAWDVAIDTTSRHLAALGLDKQVRLHYSTFTNIASDLRLDQRPVLVILDGDHLYDVVVRDIAAVDQLRSGTYGIAFHDFSLRHPTFDERVSDAVEEAFGTNYRRIGLQYGGVGHATREAPQPDGHYWLVPGSEGAIALHEDRKR